MKGKLWSKIVMASVSMLASVTCIGGAMGNVSGVKAEESANVALNYTLTTRNHNSGASGLASDIRAEKVYYTGAGYAKDLIGVELKSSLEYSNTTTNSNYTPVSGYGIHYQQSLTLKIDDVIDMSEPVEFYFSPYISTNHESHRFVMGISDDANTEVAPKVGGWAKRGFNASSSANYVYWDMALNTRWTVDEIDQAVGPAFQTIYSDESKNTNNEDYSLNSISSYKSSTRLGGGILGRAFYGSTYNSGESTPLIKAKIEFSQEYMILYFEDVYAEDITKCACGTTHDFTNDTGEDTASKCYYRQTLKLEDLGFTYGQSELNLYFGYYNAYAEHSNQSYGALPMSLKLYNYQNGDVKSFGVKEENITMKASEELTLADNMDIVYYDGVTTEATVTYTSDNDEVATIVDGKLVPVAGTIGGEVTITATASTGETASFKVTVDANTVTYNGNVIGAGNSYTVLEDLYAGNHVLIGFKANGKLYAVGDTIELTDDIVLEEVTVDYTMFYGASIRLDDTASIRFTAIINTADLTALETLVGADNVSYGMTLIPNGIDKTYTIDSKNEGFDTAVYETEYTLFSAVMTKIPETNYETDLTARAYITVTYADGESATIECQIAERKEGDTKDSNVRSLAEVAEEAYNDRKTSEEGIYKYLTNDGNYSRYTSTQLTEIEKYFN